MSGLHFVFLQGMPSSFFTRIANELAAKGCRATGFNFCLGDQIFWRGPRTVNYRGSLADWPGFFEAYLRENHVTDIVMLGDQRTFHKPAIEIAKRMGIRVAVMDFGYLRPGWLTLERDGKSANSRFPKTAEALRELAATLPQADLTGRYFEKFWNMARRDLLYSFANVLIGWLLYPRYRSSDRRPHPLIYFPSIGRRLLFARTNHRRAQSRLQALIASGARYFVFPLQLEHDYQIIAYSPYASLEEAIRTVIASFAAHAAADTRLAVKIHPWDSGLKNWEKLTRSIAQAHGVAGRVDYFDGANLGEMSQHSIGMVTVNSTSGITALQQGIPLKALGEAVYDIPGLTHPGALDTFWTNAAPPDPALANALINAIAATIQISGTFFTDPGLSVAARAAAERLHEVKVGLPLASR
jgi:capsular polysaccharide export protein